MAICHEQKPEIQVTNTCLTRFNFKAQQQSDDKLSTLIAQLEKGETVGNYNLDSDKTLYRKEIIKHPGRKECFQQLVFPQALTEKLISTYHDAPQAGHQGSGITWRKLKRSFFWKGMRSDIDRYIKSCPSCQQRKGHGQCKPPMQVFNPVSKPFERVSMDVMGPVTTSYSGAKYILVIVDHLT